MSFPDILIKVQQRSRKAEEGGGISSTDTEKPRSRKSPNFFIHENGDIHPNESMKIKGPPKAKDVPSKGTESLPEWPCSGEEMETDSQPVNCEDLPLAQSSIVAEMSSIGPGNDQDLSRSDWNREEGEAIPPSLMRSTYAFIHVIF